MEGRFGLSSGNEFEVLINSVCDALIIVDSKGEVIWSNRQLFDLLGYTVDEIVGCNINLLLPEEFREAHKVLLAQYFNRPSSRPMGYSRPLSAISKFNKSVTVDIALSPIRWKGQECALASLRENSIGTQGHASHTEIQQLLDESQSIANIGAWDWDILKDTLHWSDQIFKIFGVDKRTFTPSYSAFLSFVHYQDRAIVEDAVKQALENDSPYKAHHRIVSNDNALRHVVERGKVYRDEHGNPIRMIGTVQDVTSEYNHQMQLKLAESVFRHSFDGAISTDRAFRILRANPAFERMSGYRSNDLERISLAEIIPGIQEELISNQLNDSGHWRGALECQRANEETFPVHLSISRIDDEFSASSKYYVVTLTDISSIKMHEEQLRKLAYFDPLTSLYNRSFFIEKTSQAIELCQRKNKSLSILFVDLDGFKEINDTQGHQEGDSLLVDIALKLSQVVQDRGLLARFGGDEFVVLLRTGNISRVTKLANEMLDVLSFTKEYSSYSYKVTASVGIALYPKHGSSEQDLIKKADIAMYKAKYAGKNRLMFYQEEFGEEKSFRLRLISELEKAINNDEIEVNFQPIVESCEEEACYFEALARWNHSTEGVISPAQFIPIAEETGLIIPLGELVMKKVRAFIDTWKLVKGSDVKVAVNLSVAQLYHESLQGSINRIFGDREGICKSLIFEITESSIMHQLEPAQSKLNQLKALGSTIAIDDFGTGYSSLSYLSKLPIDIVKVDRSFVLSLPENQDDSAICKAIISLSHSLNLKVVAEGIETEAQYSHLKSLDCDYIQGYLISKPMPCEVFLS